jgi:hypothetical protein
MSNADAGFRMNFDLYTGARLEVLEFPEDETHRWIFTYHYIEAKALGEMPEVVIEYSLVVNYMCGELADTFELAMHVIIPSRLGQKSFAGVDISSGAKTYLRFVYKRWGEKSYRLHAVGKGVDPDRELPRDGGLVKQPVLPFVLLDEVEGEFGRFSVPFHHRDGSTKEFSFPYHILRFKESELPRKPREELEA